MAVYNELIETFPAHVRTPRPRYGPRIAKVLIACGLGLGIALVVKSVWFYRPTGSSGTMQLASCSSSIIYNPELPDEFVVLLSEVDQNLKQDGFQRVNQAAALDSLSTESAARIREVVPFLFYGALREIRWYRKTFEDDIPMLVAIICYTDHGGRKFSFHQHHCDVRLLWSFRGRKARATQIGEVGKSYSDHAEANWHLSYEGILEKSEKQLAVEREKWQAYEKRQKEKSAAK